MSNRNHPQRRVKKRPTVGPAFKWTGMDRTFGTHKRFYQMQTLASAIEGQMAIKDPGIVGSFRDAYGPMSVSALTFDLEGETAYHFVFRVRATVQKQAPRSLGMIVAKNHEEGAKAVAAQYRALQLLKKPLGKSVVQTFQAGRVYLPDRYRRTDVKRMLHLYMMEWSNGFSTFTADRNGQLKLTGKTPHTCTRKETEGFKVKLLGIFAAAYDPLQRTGLDQRASSFDNFLVRQTASGQIVPKLVSPPPISDKITPTRLIDRALHLEWETDGEPFALAPESPEDVYQGLSSSVDKERVRDWINAFLREKQRKATGLYREYLDALDQHVNGRASDKAASPGDSKKRGS